MRKRGRFEASPAPRPSWKTTNRHLQMMVTSAVSMLLCCTMLLGTTMAWFTDTITSSLNQITIGTLGIALKHGNTYLTNGDTLFHGNNANQRSSDGENSNTGSQSGNSWGPNFYQSKVLTVENTGDLELIYELRFLPGDGNMSSVSAAPDFDVYVSYVNTASTFDLETPVAITADMDVFGTNSGWTLVDSLADILNEGNPVATKTLAPSGSTSGSSKQTFAIALHMKSADSSIQGSSLKLDIELFAYQSNATDPTPPSATTKTAVISELDESDDTDTVESKTDTKLNSVLESPSLNKKLTNSTVNTNNQNVTNNNNSGTTDGDDDGDQVPNSGTTNGGNDDDQSSGTTGGNDNGTVVPDSGITDGNNNGAQVPDSGSTGGDDDDTPVPDSSSTGGDDDSIPVPNSDTTGGDDVTPEPNSGGQNGSETDSSQGTDNSTSVE